MRMVACDLDGTIVGRDGRISQRTLDALTACERLGVHVVFVTGRPTRWMEPIVEMTGHQGLALCGNGAVVLNLATGDVVSSRALALPTVVAVTQRLRERIPGRRSRWRPWPGTGVSRRTGRCIRRPRTPTRRRSTCCSVTTRRW
ncbi:HAD family hydrolase [Kineosporia succinea]